ncbi:type I restriction enzyme HsdR N-terminal domain-containing protein [Porphyromonadaceae bacterium OttesenSCG-928-L07]|nr:type I restriction enzyme HsdR N-terminal domain-containing protein [Porphyromonadaceae bacterium OttesenSCG-928-L07]
MSLPPFEYKVKKQHGVVYLYDIIRKKYVVLTPEEWVRQHFIHYLINDRQYPAPLIDVEKLVEINGLKRRFDIVCYDRNATPLLIVECKAPNISLSQSVFDQAFEYNSILAARYVAITNGIRHWCGTKNAEGKFCLEEEIPPFLSE